MMTTRSPHRAAVDVPLTPHDLAALDGAFPPPRDRRPLEVLRGGGWSLALAASEC
jgi:hypothetical protein